MTFAKWIGLACLAAGLSSCVLNEESFNAHREVLRARPDLQQKAMAHCVGLLKYERIEVKRYIAGYARVKLESNLPALICGRLGKGYLSGRLKYEDLRALQKGKFTPTMTAVIRN